MASLTEVSAYVEDILRLELTTPVKGYDPAVPDEVGPSNEQAQVLANRTKWLKEKLGEISKTLENGYVLSVNEDTGAVIVTHESIGAAAAKHKHGTEDIETSDSQQFVSQSQINIWNAKQNKLVDGVNIRMVNGESILIPEKDTFADGDTDIKFTTIIPVFDKNGRLAIKGRDQLDVCLQINNRNLYFLPAGETGGKNEDGSDNWIHLPSGIRYVESEEERLRIFATDGLTVCFQKDANALYFLEPSSNPTGMDWKRISGEEGRVVIATDKAERLKLNSSDIVTLCIQMDNNTLYYLEANAKSTEENWKPIATDGTSSGIDDETLDKKLADYVKKDAGDQPGGYVKIGDDGSLSSEIKINIAQIEETENRTFVHSDDRSKWNAKLDSDNFDDTLKTHLKTLNNGSLIIDPNDESDNIQIDYQTVGADESGTAARLLAEHTEYTEKEGQNPHVQYLLKTDGGKPGGYLKLDEAGKIPAEVIPAGNVVYYIAENKEERLTKVPQSDNIAVCFQLDDNLTYYLDANKDPSVESNWQHNDVSSPISIDNITYTDGSSGTPELKKLSSSDIENWNNKLDATTLEGQLKTIGENKIRLSIIDDEPDNITLDALNVYTKDITDDHIGKAVSALAVNIDKIYVPLAAGNTAEGYAQLDSSKKIYSEQIPVTESFVIKVNDKNGRLKLDKMDRMIICTQLDTDVTYYLAAGSSPSVDSNWEYSTAKIEVNADDIVFPNESDKQFLTQDDITKWDGKLDKGGLKKLAGQTLFIDSDGIANITLDDLNVYTKEATVIEAENITDAAVSDAILKHTNQTNNPDPHSQYLTEEKGNSYFVRTDSGGIPNGYLKLDAQGTIPVDKIPSTPSRFVTAKNKDDRCGLGTSPYTTVCVQLDDGRNYYLDANKDPCVEENWQISEGTMQIPARNIIESDDRTFVQATDRVNWNKKIDANDLNNTLRTICGQSLIQTADNTVNITAKDLGVQQVLVSASNIKTVCGREVLGSGDLELTAYDITETDERKFVSPNQMTSWTNKQAALKSGGQIATGDTVATVFGFDLLNTSSKNIDLMDAPNLTESVESVLVAGDNITITTDEENKKITISAQGGKKGVKVINDVPNAIAGRHYLYRDDNASFDTEFNVFKREIILKDAEMYIDYSSSDTTYDLSPLTGYDSHGGFPVGASTTSTLAPVSNLIELYSTNSLMYDSNSSEATAIRFESDGTPEVHYLPKWVNNNNPIDDFQPFCSSKITSGYEPYKIFKELIGGTGTNQTANAYEFWKSWERWREGYPTQEIFVGIKRTKQWAITSYSLQVISGFYQGDGEIAAMKGWLFQARNEDTDTWVTIDTQENQTLIVPGITTQTFLNYKLAKPAYYKQYRFLITAITNGVIYLPSVARVRFYNKSGIIIKSNGGQYYTINDTSEVINLPSPDKYDLYSRPFDNTNIISIPLIKDLFPIKICSMTNKSVTTYPYKQVSRMASHELIPHFKSWDRLLDLTITETYPQIYNNGMRIVVSIDKVNYTAFNGSEWVEIGALNNDKASAELVLSQGMTIGGFNAVSISQWNLLVSKAKGGFYIAYARAVESANAPLVPKKVQALFTDVYGWSAMPLSSVSVGFSDNYIVFTPAESGDYKFCYSFN